MVSKKYYASMIVSFIHGMHTAVFPLYGSLRIENCDGAFTRRARALYDALCVILDAAYALPDTEQADLEFHNNSSPKLWALIHELNEISEELIQVESTSADVRAAANNAKRFLLDNILNDSVVWCKGIVHASRACFTECRMRITFEPQGILGIVTHILYHDPCWVGILEPASAFEGRREEILTKLKVEDLDIQIEDLVSGETWAGRLSNVVLPETEYPWYELLWRDDRKP